MKKKDRLMAISLMLSTVSNGYDSDIDYYMDDPIVNDCLMKMYLFLLTGEQKDYEEFDLLYNTLTEEQKEMVKKDYLSILKRQEENKKLGLIK